MARFLFAWELGAGLGHLNRLLPTARRLAAQGHDLCWAVKDVLGAAHRLGSEGFTYLQAPFRPQARAREEPLSLSDILATLAFTDPEALNVQLRAWLDLLAFATPDAVVADFSPTALLAARIAGLPTASFGNGFEIPPQVAPLPTLQPWRNVPAKRLAQSDAAILETVNGLLSGHGAPAIAEVAELFRGQQTFLCTFPEFDHFGPRPQAAYCGPTLESPIRSAPASEILQRERVFFYLSGGHPFTRGVMEHLATTAMPAFGHVRDMNAAEIERYRRPTLEISASPLDIGEALAQARLVICHGGAGTTTQAILAGLPVLLLPQSIEQALLAWRLTDAGVARTVRPQPRLPSLAQPLSRLLRPDATDAAGRIAARYADFDIEDRAEAIAARCAELAAGH